MGEDELQMSEPSASTPLPSAEGNRRRRRDNAISASAIPKAGKQMQT